MHTNHSVLGGSLLITGAAIGAGILALPIVTATTGFLPSVAVFCLCGAFASLSALLLVEVGIWTEGKTHITSMVRSALGDKMAWLAGGLYLMLVYCLLAAYISGGGDLLVQFGQAAFGWQMEMPEQSASANFTKNILFLLVFGCFVVLRMDVLDWINRILMLGLVSSFFILIGFMTPHLQASHLQLHDWSEMLTGLTVVVTSFNFHHIIPNIKNYFRDDVRKIRAAILIGTGLALLIYLVWNLWIFAVLGLTGEQGLLQILTQPVPVRELTHALANTLDTSLLGVSFAWFSFFAITTSFLATALGLHGFFCDCLHLKRNRRQMLLLALISYVPPLLFCTYYPDGFIIALDYSGAAMAMLFGFLPAVMVWHGRYHRQIQEHYHLMGGRPVLLMVMLFALVIAVLECLPA